MERRDYLEREIEKMQAVLQKIFRMRVDKDEEVQEVISTELARYFDTNLLHLQRISESDFLAFIQNKNIALIDFLGSLLYASVNLDLPLDNVDQLSLKKALLAWEAWEHKTKTLDLERLENKNKIIALLNNQSN